MSVDAPSSPELDAHSREEMPTVARDDSRSRAPTVIALSGLGLAFFAWLSLHRLAVAEPTMTAQDASPAASWQDPEPAPSLPTEPRSPPPPATPPRPRPPPLPVPPPLPPTALSTVGGGAPALVVDLTEAAAPPGQDKATGIEARLTGALGAYQTNRVVARPIGDLGTVVMQGAVIPGVLETALDSELPGLARAMVTRDVESTDGAQVLIPRGSRLVGQYKSTIALGQSRVFVIWTRLIRPDGVAVDLGSPSTDELGRAGLTGSVDHRFFSRFGASTLLSVLNVGLQRLGQHRSGSQIYVGSSAAAQSLAAMALQRDAAVTPIVRVPNGARIQVLVAQDLDFSQAPPATP